MNILTKYDDWLGDDGLAAIVSHELLESVKGPNAVVFPPTFAAEKSGDPSVYNISQTRDGKLCIMDTVQSQANRMEPVFKDGEFASLVPQVVVEAGEQKVNLLDAPHRLADASMRNSELSGMIDKSIEAILAGDAVPLAKTFPTSLVFGFWDSRNTRLSMPRIIESTINAYDVEPLVRSSQYVPSLDFGDKDEGLLEGIEGADNKKFRSSAGFGHVPSVNVLGGVLVHGGIRRELSLSLVDVRNLRGPDAAATVAVRRYILGLSLVSMTHLGSGGCKLRQGSLLVRSPGTYSCELVYPDGTRTDFSITAEDSFAFAKEAADAFGVGESRTVLFSKALAAKAILKAQSKDD